MGVVYEAVQTSPKRRVALKVLGPSPGLTPRAVERFRREAAAAAKLHHKNIVLVYAKLRASPTPSTTRTGGCSGLVSSASGMPPTTSTGQRRGATTGPRAFSNTSCT
jgi:serine/threonine protein kinase